jgi:C4-dicarboxylate-specific signal transduction histidine kinase
MKKLKKDLQDVTKEFKALTKKMGQLTSKLKKTAVDELGHAQAAIKLKSPAQHAAGALKTLTKQTDKLIKAVDKFEKEKAAKRKKAKAKAKPKKVVRKKAPAKKKPVAKKAKKVTDTDRVLNIVKRYKKGVDVPTLIKKTGFEDKKVRNIINRTLKQGKIKRVGSGVYAGI